MAPARITLGVAALALSLLGCGLTPVPEPPQAMPPDIARIDIEPPAGSVGVIRIIGGPGSVEGGAIVWAINLDNVDPPVVATALADGSFEVSISGLSGAELRLQARMGDLRSTPVDVRTPPIASSPMLIERQACIVLDPAAELALGSTSVSTTTRGTIAIRNDCGAGVSIASLRLRAGMPSFVVDTAAPIAISPGASAAIDVSFTPAAAGLLEEILFADIETPTPERRPVTLVGRGLP